MKNGDSFAHLEGLSIQEILWLHWRRSGERLKALADLADGRPPLNRHTEYSPELVHRANVRAEAFQLLFTRMRRIENYLDRGSRRPVTDSLSALSLAQLVRTNIQRGDSDQAIAILLERWKTPEKKRGRPAGSRDSDNLTVLALQLHNSNKKLWTWPKVADRLLNCKLHEKHEWDSTCTVRLRQAVTQLKRFLQELQADSAAPL